VEQPSGFGGFGGGGGGDASEPEPPEGGGSSSGADDASAESSGCGVATKTARGGWLLAFAAGFACVRRSQRARP
jgi:hypothetical protein